MGKDEFNETQSLQINKIVIINTLKKSIKTTDNKNYALFIKQLFPFIINEK